MDILEMVRQQLRRDIIHPVQRADGGVHCTVQIQLLGALTEKKRRNDSAAGLGLRLRQHLDGLIRRDHFVAAPRQLPCQSACAAA